MAEESLEAGKRFSLVYLRTDEVLADSERMRMRMAKLFSQVARSSGNHDVEFGHFVEGELGIKVLRSTGMGSYFSYETVLKEANIQDILDMVTLLWRYLPRGRGQESFLKEMRRIFAESQMGYRIDDEGGVHPAFDGAFEAVRSSVVRGLGGPEYATERKFLDDVESALKADPVNGRQAIRCVFDAVENFFKQMYPGAPRLSGQFIVQHLRPEVAEILAEEKYATEREASFKSIESFKSWVDGAHYYRHADGKPEPFQPSDDYAVHVVSQGLGFLRWLVDLKGRRA